MMKVLVADDDQVFVELISSRLRSEQFRVIVAFDAAQAIMLAMKQQPDAILLDIRMPGGSGIDTLRKLKTSVKTALIPVVVVTALEDPAAEQAARTAGAHSFLRKPAPFEQVHAALRAALGQAQGEGEARRR